MALNNKKSLTADSYKNIKKHSPKYTDRVPWTDLVVFLGLHYTGISERFLKNKLMEVLLKLVKTENLEDQKHRERVWNHNNETNENYLQAESGKFWII